MHMWREKRLRHKTHLNRNPLDYLGYPNAFKEEVTEHWRKRNEWEREHGLEFLSKDTKTHQVKSLQNKPQLCSPYFYLTSRLSLHPTPLAPTSHRSNVEESKAHWTRMELNLLTLDLLGFFFLAVWLWRLAFLRASFSSCLNAIHRPKCCISIKATKLKMLLHLTLPWLPGQGLGTEVTPSFALSACSPRLITHSGAKVMPSQQFRKPPWKPWRVIQTAHK